MSKILLILVGVIALLVVVGWVGLQTKLAPFPPFTGQAGKLETIPMPKGLPAPVERFYRVLYGDNIPIIKSAVITGRAEVRPAGPFYVPARFRFTHIAGQGYRHYIEAGIFGLPALKVYESYLDGVGFGDTPFGKDQGEKFNQATNLALWSESLWLPAILVTDSRVHWQPVDSDTAIMVVPFNQSEQHYVIRFNPQTGLIDWLESMRYHNSSSPDKTLWLNQALEWKIVNGTWTNTSGAATWMDDGKPWAIFHAEEIIYNADVQEYIRQKGL